MAASAARPAVEHTKKHRRGEPAALHSKGREMTQSSTPSVTAKPAVLINQYPYFDPAGNKCQRVRLRFICGHEEEHLSLDLGRMGGYKWKPRTNRQLMDEHLRITCPIAWKLCRKCSEAVS